MYSCVNWSVKNGYNRITCVTLMCCGARFTYRNLSLMLLRSCWGGKRRYIATTGYSLVNGVDPIHNEGSMNEFKYDKEICFLSSTSLSLSSLLVHRNITLSPTLYHPSLLLIDLLKPSSSHSSKQDVPICKVRAKSPSILLK